MPEPILHRYDISAFSERVRLAMGLKGLRERAADRFKTAEHDCFTDRAALACRPHRLTNQPIASPHLAVGRND